MKLNCFKCGVRPFLLTAETMCGAAVSGLVPGLDCMMKGP